MTTPLTPAQQVQQKNRDTDGKYSTKAHSEADVGLSLTPVTDRREQKEALYTALAEDDITHMQVSSDDGENFHITSVTPDDFNAFDAATDHLSGTDLTWDDLCVEAGNWVEGQITVTLDVEAKMRQINQRKFNKIAQTPTEADHDIGYRAAMLQMQAERHHLLQGGQPSQQHLRATIDGHRRYSEIQKKRALEEADLASYGRAFEQGVPIDPVDEANFEKIWAGEWKEDPNRGMEHPGYSEQDFQRHIETFQKDRKWIEEGSLSPGELMGRGTSKQEALDAIDRDIEMFERAIETRGRSLKSNVIAMRNAVR